jgi:hypothetical protein
MSVNLTKSTTPAVQLVTADDVRAWATKRGIETKAHGRLSASLVSAFNAAHKSKRYEVSMVQPARVIVISGKRADASGRNRPVKLRATHGEVRAWARANGHQVGTAGRIPAAVMTAFANRDAAVKA